MAMAYGIPTGPPANDEAYEIPNGTEASVDEGLYDLAEASLLQELSLRMRWSNF